jgi:starch synthase
VEFPVLKILFLSSEVSPFSHTSPAGDVAAALPRALKKVGHEVRVVTPRYREIRERKYGLRDVSRLRDLSIDVGGKLIQADVKSGFIPGSKVQVYFVENNVLFPHSPADFFNAPTASEFDPPLSFTFLVHTALQLVGHLNWPPDVVYCCNWETAVAPYMVRHHPKYKQAFSAAMTVLHRFRDNSEIRVPNAQAAEFGLDGIVGRTRKRSFSLLELGMTAADYVLTAGEAPNLPEATRSEGLIENFCEAGNEWNPRTDPHLHRNYSSDDLLQGKAANKEAIQRQFGLQLAADTPLVALWGRSRAGDHLPVLQHIERELPNLPAQIIAVGDEGSAIKDYARRWATQYAGRVVSVSGEEECDVRLIEAGSDIAMLPAEYLYKDPHPVCSLLYGTVPVVCRKFDSSAAPHIADFDGVGGSGNGFVFNPANGEEAVGALKRAVEAYKDKPAWTEIQRRSMNMDFCWEQTARSLTDSFRQTLARLRQA